MAGNSNQIYVPRLKFVSVILIIAFFALILASTRMFKTVPPGHVGVATLFGEVQSNVFPEGLNFPVNPLYEWVLYDARQKSHQEQAAVPSQDQLRTQVDVSVQYRIDGSKAPLILKETGTAAQVMEVHLIPKVRSLLREQGKKVKRAEDFFSDEMQDMFQKTLTEELSEYLLTKGIIVEQVLLRDIKLPDFILRAIESKKEREQEVEKQKAELERYQTEQQQVVVKAKAENEAAEMEAQRRKLLADAKAYEIQQINEAIKNNPAYIQLEALKTLTDISSDPAAKLYFINGDSPMPLPLMHIGQEAAAGKPVSQ
ncbi:MAG: hypothetical protein JW745_03700 [Sedimentisphaerales bacterium]|nr:hypothetical protein [Sedimentisphaerales bacterium]MBN2842879.1 hypothetical protein [Sedimentisphaerales bacterium]